MAPSARDWRYAGLVQTLSGGPKATPLRPPRRSRSLLTRLPRAVQALRDQTEDDSPQRPDTGRIDAAGASSGFCAGVRSGTADPVRARSPASAPKGRRQIGNVRQQRQIDPSRTARDPISGIPPHHRIAVPRVPIAWFSSAFGIVPHLTAARRRDRIERLRLTPPREIGGGAGRHSWRWQAAGHRAPARSRRSTNGRSSGLPG